jgi:hypothetical protein
MSGPSSAEEPSPRDEWLLDSLARQAAVMATLAGTARAGGADVEGSLGWWGLERQAGRFLRNLAARSRGPAAKRWSDELRAHHELLTGYGDEARAPSPEPSQAWRPRLNPDWDCASLSSARVAPVSP